MEVEPEITVDARSTVRAQEQDPDPTPISIPAADPDTERPAGVVDAFYTWYLDPQRSGDFTTSAYLTRRQIDAAAQAMDRRVGADPFLLAQETPAAIRVEEVTVGVGTAQVVLHQYFNAADVDEGISWDLTLDLVRKDEGWKIDRIQRGSPLTGEGVVQLFYNWYFSYGASEQGPGSAGYALAQSGNPLADRAYRSSPYLSARFITEVDALLAEFISSAEISETTVYDPFLRALNHPAGFHVMAHSNQIDGADTIVPVQLSYGSMQTTIDVIVGDVDGRWQIVDVQGDLPDEATAASQVVALFSDSYFGRWYAYADAHDLPHVGDVDLAPFLDETAGIYEQSPYLSPAFSVVNREQGSNDGDAIDPFFQASAVPATMEIDDAWADGDRAEVRVLQRWYEGHEVRPLTIKLGRAEGRWLIEAVVPIREEMATVVNPRSEMHPADVVRAFFSGYLLNGGYAGGAHRHNDYLSPAFAESVEYDVGHLRDLGVPVDEYDPILHSAISVLPGQMHVEVGAVSVDEELHIAMAQANRIYENGASLPLAVLLARDWDNHWAIQDIGAVNAAGLWEEGVGATEALWLGMEKAYIYDWALAYLLHGERADVLPELLNFDMETEGDMTFCTESPPLAFVIDSIFVEPDHEQDARRARMVVRSTEAHTLLILDLEKRDWKWVIVGQQCGDTPVGRAAAFYTAYLSAAENRMAERAYAHGDYLTADLIMNIDEAAAAGGNALKLARATPRWFEASPGPTDKSANVTLTFEDGTRQVFTLSFVLVDGRWLLSDVSETE
ncbi:MAG: DUF3828 domain-containing protein [Chloroflexota bacterium]